MSILGDKRLVPKKVQTTLDVHRTHTPRCEVKKIIALWRMHAVMQGWKEVRVVKTESHDNRSVQK